MRKIFNDISDVLEQERNRLRIDLPKNLVMHNVIVTWACGSLKYGVHLQEEIPVLHFSHTAVDGGAGFSIAKPIAVLLGSRVESRFVPLAADYDGEAWKAFFGVGYWVHLFAYAAELGKLLREDHVVLAFRDSVAVDENIFGESGVFAFSLPEVKARLQQLGEVVHVLLPCALDA
jgi:hypothetical protein